jgi:tetratricopeptide (TPR) repeat protein
MARRLANPRWLERAAAPYTRGVNPVSRSRSSVARACVAAGLLAGLALSGCEAADPLEAIRRQQASGDFEGSVAPLRELLSERHDDPEANYLYGRALIYTRQPSLATWPLLQAMEDPAWLEAAGLELAGAGLVTGDFNEVVDVATRILEDRPELAVALLYRAQALAHWKKDPEAALEDAKRVLELEPEMIEAYEPLILALLELDRHAEASEALAEAGRRLAALDAPASGLAWHCSTTAIFADEAGETDRALETWRECLEQYPADSNVVGNATQFYDARGEWERSLDVMRRALDAAPDQRAYRTALAERLRHAGEAAEAEALLRDATQVEDPRVAAYAWSDLAQFRHGMRDHAAAADALARAIERIEEVEDPGPQLRFRYADALVVSGQLDRALAVAEEITVPAQRELIVGRVAQERGEPGRALEHFDEALRLWPDNPWARYYAALAAERLGDFDRALEEYRYSIRTSVGATDARTRGAKLLIAQQQPLLAYQLLFLEVGKAPLDPEGELLSMYLMARVANPKQLQDSLTELAARSPARLPLALVRGAEGAAETAGPRAAMSLLRDAPGVDYSDPLAGPALRALVRFAYAAGEPEVAARAVEAALAAHPEAAVFHEVRGLQLELSGAAPDEVSAAYARAVALDAANAGALAGLGRLARDRDPAQAVALFDRAAAAEPSDPEPKLEAARALRASGPPEAVVRRLDALLDQHPFETQAAADLVSLDIERGVVTPRTLERARRAARFGGGIEEYEQLSRIYAQLEQPEKAEAAARHAQLLRERLAESATSGG